MSALGDSVLSKTVYQTYDCSFSKKLIEPVYYPLKTGLTLNGYLDSFPGLIVILSGPDEFIKSVSTLYVTSLS